VAAFVIVLFDHISTFSAERSLIWPAVPSFTKYTFLINRYLVPVALLLSFLPLSGFLGLSFSDNVRLALKIRDAVVYSVGRRALVFFQRSAPWRSARSRSGTGLS
jgi:hypothetical protein